jgi:hypothetical protein
MQTDHPDQETHHGRTERHRYAEHVVDTAALGGYE